MLLSCHSDPRLFRRIFTKLIALINEQAFLPSYLTYLISPFTDDAFLTINQYDLTLLKDLPQDNEDIAFKFTNVLDVLHSFSIYHNDSSLWQYSYAFLTTLPRASNHQFIRDQSIYELRGLAAFCDPVEILSLMDEIKVKVWAWQDPVKFSEKVWQQVEDEQGCLRIRAFEEGKEVKVQVSKGLIKERVVNRIFDTMEISRRVVDLVFKSKTFSQVDEILKAILKTIQCSSDGLNRYLKYMETFKELQATLKSSSQLCNIYVIISQLEQIDALNDCKIKKNSINEVNPHSIQKSIESTIILLKRLSQDPIEMQEREAEVLLILQNLIALISSQQLDTISLKYQLANTQSLKDLHDIMIKVKDNLTSGQTPARQIERVLEFVSLHQKIQSQSLHTYLSNLVGNTLGPEFQDFLNLINSEVQTSSQLKTLVGKGFGNSCIAQLVMNKVFT
ncbi:hypothetical protein FGO68_gene5564 [Halteria grandinella]|uniref:Uncharacterized protein n=1 Tax=Halteria grandinella TaxID=5974 RepID=A0A8J8P6R7_HALGN|nr:hypothetical protein FGO68_gene5564 [Halteria grandinella]